MLSHQYFPFSIYCDHDNLLSGIDVWKESMQEMLFDVIDAFGMVMIVSTPLLFFVQMLQFLLDEDTAGSRKLFGSLSDDNWRLTVGNPFTPIPDIDARAEQIDGDLLFRLEKLISLASYWSYFISSRTSPHRHSGCPIAGLCRLFAIGELLQSWARQLG